MKKSTLKITYLKLQIDLMNDTLSYFRKNFPQRLSIERNSLSDTIHMAVITLYSFNVSQEPMH